MEEGVLSIQMTAVDSKPVKALTKQKIPKIRTET